MVLKVIKYKDMFFVLDNEVVYEPEEDTLLILENLKLSKCEKLLDMGCGCGIIGIYFSKFCNDVLLIDINPYAVLFSKINIEVNKRNNVRVIQGDLFDEIEEKFDVCIFNPPYLPEKEPSDVLDLAWCSSGVIKSFLKEVKNYANKVYIVLNNLTINILKDFNYSWKIIAKKKLFFEELYLIEIEFNRNIPKS